MSPIILIFSLLVALVGAAEPSINPSNRCDQIPLGHANYQDWIRFSPFYHYRSNVGEYNCTTIQFVGPAGTDTSYSGTTILINGNEAITYGLTLVDNSLLHSRRCSDGTFAIYRVLFSNTYSTGNASYCVAICDKQGVNIEGLACAGRTPEDEKYIQNYLDTKLKVPIVGPVFNSQWNCPAPKSCVAFT